MKYCKSESCRYNEIPPQTPRRDFIFKPYMTATGKYLGIDYGSRWIGLAVSDALHAFAFPYEELQNDARVFDVLNEIIAKEQIVKIIVGDTRAHTGEANTVTNEAELFCEKLRSTTGVDVSTVFEAWSSQEAARFAPQGDKHNHASAAAIILQRALDMIH